MCMSVYHSSFNYLGINSRLKNLIIAHFDGDNGEEETGLSLDPIYTDSSLGLRRYDYGAKYNSVATFRITVVKPDGTDMSVAEVRNHLKWLTGTYNNTTLELLVGEQIKCVFSGRFSNVWQQKLDARTIGLVLEFTSISPFAYSPKQTFTRTINRIATFQINCPSDDLFSYVYLKTTYNNINENALRIENVTTGEITEVTDLRLNETITLDGPMIITSDNTARSFGDTFNLTFPRLKPGINELLIEANGPLTFEYAYPIKIGNVAVDIEELNNTIDCDSNPGPGTIVTEHTAWENIWNKPYTLAGFGINNAYTKDEVNQIAQGVSTTITANLTQEINSVETSLRTDVNRLNETLTSTTQTINSKIDAVSEEINSDVEKLDKELDSLTANVYTKTEVNNKISAIDLSPYLTSDDAANTYASKTEVEEQFDEVYTKTEIDTKLSEFVSDDVYTKEEIDDMLSHVSVIVPVDTYTKAEIDEKFKNITTSGVDISEDELNTMLSEVLE